MSRYLIGIDLGTTNSALAYIDLDHTPRGSSRVHIRPFPVPQLVAPGEMKDRALLPSFLYLPGQHDLPPGSTALPWDAGRDYAVGEFARNHGGKVPGRLVTSAKSWLCHPGVDRTSPLLPWSAPPDVPRLSPVEASTRYLRHFVEAWDHVMARGHDALRLAKQAVVLTVPASFDDVARTLTMDAAAKAGLENVTLLEEPQAAFYCWMQQREDERNRLKPGMLCLVVDVGGGTTDFSLIRAVEDKGEIAFVRDAIGDHLLLGGDNMDLALAKFVEARLPAAGKLDAAQYALLTQACRAAKEALLSPNPPASHPVTVVGRGRAVIAGTLSTQLTPDDVRQALFEGFFPVTAVGDMPQRGARAGLHEMGLPYVSDPAITRHLAAFLHGQAHGSDLVPAAILFNGGVFQPQALRDRLIGILHGWYDRPGAAWQPLVLSNPSLDLAVAMGSAYYGWLRHVGGKRIGGGIPRSYYVAIEAEDSATTEMAVVCVVPQHLEEGQEVNLPKPELELALGQPVTFPLFTSTVRSDDKPGDVLRLRRDQLLTLPPLTTVLRGGKRAGTKRVPVTLAARSTAIGTLELFCVAKEGENRWKLEFNIRELVKEAPPRDDVADAAGLTEVWLEEQVQEAGRLVRACYQGEPGGPAPQELPRALEAALDASRSEWPTGLCRRMWDFLAEVADRRRESPQHLSRWYNLVGHCLRPGFGDSLDRFRIEQLWKMLAAPPRQAGQPAARAVEGGADAWVLWRRVSGGLSAPLQNALFDRLRPTLLPAKGRQVMRPGANELAEMWRAAASLERLQAGHKELLGNALLKSVQKTPVPPYAFWALTRVGARQLLYGPLNCVVHHQTAEAWLDAILGFQPGHESERLGWAFCLSQLARRTGQRALDVDEGHQARVLAVLKGLAVPEHWVQMVAEVSELAGDEQGQMLGDSLPIGLRLARPAE